MSLVRVYALVCLALPIVNAGGVPRWEALVINLDRRPDRLRRFVAAAREREPWLLLGNHLCRIPGRDGRQLRAKEPHWLLDDSLRGSLLQRSDPQNETAVSTSASNQQGTKAKVRNESTVLTRAVTKQVVPQSLHDAAALVDAGWTTAQALREAENPKSAWPKMTPGGIGLYLSHAAAWRYVVDAGLDYGLIFEDDLTLFSPNFREKISKILRGRDDAATANSSWDFLYLQRCNDEACHKQRVFGKDAQTQSMQSSQSVEVQIPQGESVTCTGAYVITRAGAEKLLVGAFPAAEQLDHQLAAVPGLRRAALSPPVAQCEEVVVQGAWRYRDTDVQHDERDIAQLPKKLAKWLGLHQGAAGHLRKSGPLLPICEP